MATSKTGLDANKNSDSPNFLYLSLLRHGIYLKRKGYRDYLRHTVSEICAVGEHMKHDSEQWRRLVEANWGSLKAPKVSDQQNALRHALRWAIGTSPLGPKTASFYYNAVAPLVAKGLQGKKLRKAIRKTGFKKLQAQHSRSRKSEAIVEDAAEKAEAPKPKPKLKSRHTPATARHEDEVSEDPATAATPTGRAKLVWPTKILFSSEPKLLLGLKPGTLVKITGSVAVSDGQLLLKEAKIKVKT